LLVAKIGVSSSAALWTAGARAQRWRACGLFPPRRAEPPDFDAQNAERRPFLRLAFRHVHQ
jgi:hypothetical protein